MASVKELRSLIRTLKELGRRDLFALTLSFVAVFMVAVSFVAWAVAGRDINQVKDLLLAVLSAIAGALRPGGSSADASEVNEQAEGKEEEGAGSELVKSS